LPKITRENLCHRYSASGKSFETGIVPVARYSHLCQEHCSQIVNTNHPIKIKHFHMLCTKLELELPTLPEHMSSPSFFSGVRVTRSLVLCVCFVDRCLSFCTFSFTVVFSVLLRYTDSDYLPLVSLNSSCDNLIFMFCVILNSNMTSFFRFVNKRASYPFGIISLIHAPVNVTDFSIGSINCVRHFPQT
jgi:hypothetical protein